MRLQVAAAALPELQETRTLPDLWGLGLEFEIYSTAHEPWVEFETNLPSKTEIAGNFQRAIAKAVEEQDEQARGRRRRKLTKAQKERQNRRIRMRALELMDFSAGDALDELIPGIPLLIKRVTSQKTAVFFGPKEDAEEATREEVEELLGLGHPLLSDNEYGEHNTLGRAIAAWILEEARDREVFDADFVEEASEELGPTPDGGSGSGED